MTVAEFRKLVKTTFPHVTIKVRTVSFSDLARAERKCLTVIGVYRLSELIQINEWALKAGIMPDRRMREFNTSSIETGVSL